MVKTFSPQDLKRLYIPNADSTGEQNGQVTVIGGSRLFHGAPLFSLKIASRFVDMVFFASPDPNLGRVAEKLKSSLFSFIWVPFTEVEKYIEKSDAVLIGPGLKRFTSESQDPNNKFQMTNDKDGKKTREITERLLKKFPNKKWVIDAGSLQTMEASWIPPDSIITPNRKEFEMLFGQKIFNLRLEIEELVNLVETKAREYKCVIVMKGPETIVASLTNSILVKGGNAGLTKGGSGDVLAGLTVSLLAKNDALLAATCASYVAKSAADELFKSVGVNYNADDLAGKIPEVLHNMLQN